MTFFKQIPFPKVGLDSLPLPDRHPQSQVPGRYATVWIGESILEELQFQGGVLTIGWLPWCLGGLTRGRYDETAGRSASGSFPAAYGKQQSFISSRVEPWNFPWKPIWFTWPPFWLRQQIQAGNLELGRWNPRLKAGALPDCPRNSVLRCSRRPQQRWNSR